MRKTFELTLHPDPRPDLIIERGPDDTGVGSWVPNDKHTLLAKYIAGACGPARRFPHWIFIDPFCGPGRIQVRGETITRDGGSAVAWHQSKASNLPFTQMLIGDLSVERVRACKARLEAVGAPAQAFEGAAVETIPKMVASVPRGALCLVYIDPYNLQYLSFSMIEALAKLSKVDLVVNFCTMDLRRNVDAELDPDRARFDEVAPGWRQKFGASSGKTTLGLALFNYWMELISGLGFSFSQAMPMVQNDSNREIYRLAFFARHDLPNRIWNDVARDPTRDLFG